MSSPTPAPAPVGLARWRRRLGARLQRQATPLFLTAEGLLPLRGESRAHSLPDGAQAHAGQAVQLIVSARLLHELVCEPGLPLVEEAQLQAYGRQQFSHYFGAAARHWPLASWRAGKASCGLSALHGLDWAALRQALAEQEVRLRQVRPAWAPVLQRLLASESEWAAAPSAALAWVEGQVLTWLSLHEGSLQSLRQLRLAAASGPALQATLAELRQGQAGPVLVLGYGLEAGLPLAHSPGLRVLGNLSATAPQEAWFAAPREPAAGAAAPDFLGPRRPLSRLGLGLALTAALVLATAGWGLWQGHQNRLAAQQERAGLEAKARSLGPARKPVPTSLAVPAEQLQQQRAAQEVQKLLQQNWEPLLANVEQAGLSVPGLSWLALDYAAARGELRLEGLAPDKLAPLQLADRLGAAPGWRELMLSRLQLAEQGLSGQRFELTAKLLPAQLQLELPLIPDAGERKKQP